MRTLRLITDCTAEPVPVADLKLFMRLSTASTTEDALLTALEKAARKHGEFHVAALHATDVSTDHG